MYDHVSWDNIIGLKKLHFSEALYYSALFIIFDVQILIFQSNLYSEVIFAYEETQRKLRPLRKQDYFHSFQEKLRVEYQELRLQRIEALQNLEKVFSAKNSAKIWWSNYSDEELWPYFPIYRNEKLVINLKYEEKDERAIIGVANEYKIVFWSYEFKKNLGISSNLSYSDCKIPIFSFFPEEVHESLKLWIDAVFALDSDLADAQLGIRTILLKSILNQDHSDTDEIPLYVQIFVRPLFEANGKFLGAGLLIEEISDMKYLHSRRSLSSYDPLEDKNIASILLDREMKIIARNRYFEHMIKAERENLDQISLWDLFSSSETSSGSLEFVVQKMRSQSLSKSESLSLILTDLSKRKIQVIVTFCEFSSSSNALVCFKVTFKAQNLEDKLRFWYRHALKEFQAFLKSRIDDSLFKNSEFANRSSKQVETIQKASTVHLIIRYIGSHTQEIAFLVLFLNLFIQGSIVSLIVPFTILFYAFTEFPFALNGYWLGCCAYISMIIFLKFTYQLDIFCTSTNGNVYIQPNANCVSNNSFQSSYLSRNDYVFGIHKASGSATLYILFDVLCLLVIAFHRYMISRKDGWSSDGRPTENNESNLKAKMNAFFKDNENSSSFFGIHYTLNIIFSYMKADQPTFIQRYFYCVQPMNPVAKAELDSELKPGRDFYTVTFFFELISAIYAVFFWSKLVSSSDNVQTAFANNRFPWEMVGFFISQILVIFSERIIYLKKSIVSKYFLQIVTLFYFSWFIFYYCPIQNAKGGFTTNSFLIIFFLLKICYFILSSLQIRHGYISDILQHNFFTRNTSALKAKLFSIYLSIPFVVELRTILNWISVDTSLSLKDTFTLEDMYTKVFLIKTELDVDQEDFRGRRKPFSSKISTGSLLVFGILFLLLGPLLLFSDANPSSKVNNVKSGRISIALSGSQGSLEVFVCTSLVSISQVSSDMYADLVSNGYIRSDDDISTVQEVRFASFSDQEWIITKPGLDLFLSEISNPGRALTISASYQFNRPFPAGYETITGSTSTLIGSNDQLDFFNHVRDSTLSPARLQVSGILPKKLRLPGSSSISILDFENDEAGNFELALYNNDTSKYWTLTDNSTKSGISFYTVSDPIFESSLLNTLSDNAGYGIITVYATVVIAIGNFLRQSTGGQLYTLIYDRMLNVDDILVVFEGVYISRMLKDFKQEETLFRILVRIFRSPETILKMTRRRRGVE